MIDRKKVIKGLELCGFGFSEACYGKECPYYQSHDCTDELKNDILALLKEWEPKTIRGFADTVEGVVIGNCPRCDRLIVGKENDPAWFCKYCGQAVNWE